MADFKVIKDKQDQLVLAATDIAAIIVPYGTELGPVVDDATGELLEAPTGAQTLGEIQKSAGVDLSPDMNTEGIQGYGSRADRRIFVTEESFEVELTVQEIRAAAYKMFLSVGDEDVTNGAFTTRMKKSASGDVQYYGLILIAKDLAKEGEIFPFWKFRKVAVTNKGSMSLAEAAEMGIPLTFTIFEDDGEMMEVGLGGKGWPALRSLAGFGEAPSDDSGE